MKVTILIEGRISKSTHTRTGSFHFDDEGEIQPGTPPRAGSPILVSAYTTTRPFNVSLSYEVDSESESRPLSVPSLDEMSFSEVDSLSSDTTATPTLAALKIGFEDTTQLDDFYLACQSLIFEIRSFSKSKSMRYSGNVTITKIVNGVSSTLLDHLICSSDDANLVATFIATNVSGSRRVQSLPFQSLCL